MQLGRFSVAVLLITIITTCGLYVKCLEDENASNKELPLPANGNGTLIDLSKVPEDAVPVDPEFEAIMKRRRLSKQRKKAATTTNMTARLSTSILREIDSGSQMNTDTSESSALRMKHQAQTFTSTRSTTKGSLTPSFRRNHAALSNTSSVSKIGNSQQFELSSSFSTAFLRLMRFLLQSHEGSPLEINRSTTFVINSTHTAQTSPTTDKVTMSLSGSTSIGMPSTRKYSSLFVKEREAVLGNSLQSTDKSSSHHPSNLYGLSATAIFRFPQLRNNSSATNPIPTFTTSAARNGSSITTRKFMLPSYGSTSAGRTTKESLALKQMQTTINSTSVLSSSNYIFHHSVDSSDQGVSTHSPVAKLDNGNFLANERYAIKNYSFLFFGKTQTSPDNSSLSSAEESNEHSVNLPYPSSIARLTNSSVATSTGSSFVWIIQINDSSITTEEATLPINGSSSFKITQPPCCRQATRTTQNGPVDEDGKIARNSSSSHFEQIRTILNRTSLSSNAGYSSQHRVSLSNSGVIIPTIVAQPVRGTSMKSFDLKFIQTSQMPPHGSASQGGIYRERNLASVFGDHTKYVHLQVAEDEEELD